MACHRTPIGTSDVPMGITHHLLLALTPRLSSDYAPWGEVDREASWARGEQASDCSCDCRWNLPVEGKLGMDWGVCCRPSGPRAGLLTFEHQAGYGCFERRRGRP